MGICVSSAIDEEEGRVKWTEEIDCETAEFLAREAKNDEQLVGLQGRMCDSGASSDATAHTRQGKKGPNQDSMILWENFGAREDTVFLGVFDGHGPYGHVVSRRVRDSMPSMLLNQWHELLSAECVDIDGNNLEDTDRNKFYDGDQHEEPKMFEVWKESHMRAFKVMDKELKLHPALDCYCSGTTAVTVVKQGQDLVIANLGDSRAVLGTISPDGSLSAIQLTTDMKANLPQEAERIRQCNGRVIALPDEPHVHRVWLPNENGPGLAMTRAFGDLCLKDFGVIATPEVTYRRLTNRDQFIVLATDGVWDVLSNKEVVKIVSSASPRSAATRMVVESAVRAWRYKFPTSKIDDCAVVCLYLDSHPFISEYGQGNTNDAVQSLEELPSMEQPKLTRANTVFSLSGFLKGSRKVTGAKRKR
uniref:protein-serine/threonine phosphatase n=1 Tax=Araucaria cunninghamii TaxID=56994 RepID=A0A0D6R532_ARACU